MSRYSYTPFDYATPPELRGRAGRRWPVVIVGAGPVGLTAAIDLALHGIETLLLDDNNVVSVGSRAICWAKRTLEIFDRLGVGERMVAKGVTWRMGRLYRGDTEIYAFDLLPEDGHKHPAFINLQQYYVEQYLVERCGDFPGLIDVRWKNRVTGVTQTPDGAVVEIATPDGGYIVEADYVLACDGANSPVRGMLGLDFEGRVFEERFLITDVEVKADFPSERRFWFDPPFHKGQSALLHKQPDDIYRIDLQLGPDADPEAEKQPARVIPRIKAVLGKRPFEIDWVSVYTFQCRRMARFVHDRVIFAGDSAHIVSPFGARGGNSGVQDADNLVWKLAAVLKGAAPPGLLESYNAERLHAADENIRHSARATSFMTPKSEMEAIFRRATLDLAETMPFARRLVNSGRLSLPCQLDGLALQTPAADSRGDVGLAPGAPCPDAPLSDREGKPQWLLDQLGGDFALLSLGTDAPAIEGLPQITIGNSGFADPTGHAKARYGEGLSYLIRPDQHVAARFEAPMAASINAALTRARGGNI